RLQPRELLQLRAERPTRRGGSENDGRGSAPGKENRARERGREPGGHRRDYLLGGCFERKVPDGRRREPQQAPQQHIVGQPDQCHLQSGGGFKVDVDGVKDLSTAVVGSFNGASALLVGQNVEVRRVSGDGSSSNPIVADRVKLKMSRFTAKVKPRWTPTPSPWTPNCWN